MVISFRIPAFLPPHVVLDEKMKVKRPRKRRRFRVCSAPYVRSDSDEDEQMNEETRSEDVVVDPVVVADPVDVAEPMVRTRRRVSEQNKEELHREELCQRLKSGYTVPHEVYDFGPPMGRGVVAGRDIAAGEFVCKYSGDWHTAKDFVEPEGGTSPYEVRFTCALPVPGGVSRETIVIDPRQDDGTIGRLINHACTPADNLQPKWGFVAGRPRIWFEAKQIIRKNQQFAWTYGERRSSVLAANPWLRNNCILPAKPTAGE